MLARVSYLEVINEFWLGIRTDPNTFWDCHKPPSDILYYLFMQSNMLSLKDHKTKNTNQLWKMLRYSVKYSGNI